MKTTLMAETAARMAVDRVSVLAERAEALAAGPATTSCLRVATVEMMSSARIAKAAARQRVAHLACLLGARSQAVAAPRPQDWASIRRKVAKVRHRVT
jgi:hypothetical protein